MTLSIPRRRRWGWSLATVRLLKGGDAREEPDAARRRQAERLFRTYGDAVYRCAYAFLRQAGDAEDVLQETLLAYLRAQPELESPEHEKAWLLRVAANLAKNRLRYRSAHAPDELSERLAQEEREDLSFVWEAVGCLSPDQREAVHLFYQEGYTTREIAGLLGRRESTVRSDLRRARERLKTILKEEYDFD